MSIVIILIVLILLGYFGYRFMQHKQLPQVATTQPCAFDEGYCKYMQKSVTALSQPMVGTSVSETKEGTMTSTWETDGKGNMRTTSTSPTGETSSTIILNKAVYSKDPQRNVWIEHSSETSNTQVSEEQKKLFETKDSMQVTKKGVERCGNVQCIVYEVSGVMGDDEKILMYIDTSEYLLRKTVSEFEQNTTTTTFEYKAVTITKPSPVEKLTVPPAAAGEPVAPSGVNMDEVQEMMRKYGQDAP